MTTFKSLGLNKFVQQSLDALGFEKPTPIQAKAIPFLLESTQDLIALAQTGTGKTAAFGLPIISQLEPGSRELQAIILCPTRELCLQITRDLQKYSEHSREVSVVPVYGGENMYIQIKALRSGANIVVGTPGRVCDLIRRKALKLGAIKWLVLDEADEMLDMGFKEDLDAVLAETNTDRQVLLFSATMSKSVYAIAKQYMRKPHEISVGQQNTGADKVTHQYYIVHAKDRYEALRRILDTLPDVYGILFCRTKIETQEIADRLKQDRYSTEALHGDVSQNIRTLIMDRFRKKQVQLLVATDVAARGIDVSDLTHIINYSIPDSTETYIHRSGRTGRAQKSGVCLSIIHMKETRKIRDLEYKVGKKFEQKKIPSGKEVSEIQLLNLLERFKNVEVDEKHIAKFLPTVYEKLSDLDREEIITRFIAFEFSHFLDLYKGAQDLNVNAMSKDQPRVRDDEANFFDVRLNLGKKDNLDVKTLFGLVNAQRDLKGAKIGKVSIFDSYTIFGLEKGSEDALRRSFGNAHFKGRTIEARPYAKEKGFDYNRAPHHKANPKKFENKKFGGKKFGKKKY